MYNSTGNRFISNSSNDIGPTVYYLSVLIHIAYTRTMLQCIDFKITFPLHHISYRNNVYNMLFEGITIVV